MKKSLKKFSIFISSFFIFLIHLPFVFAKTIPHTQPSSDSSVNIAGNNTDEWPNSNKISVYDSLQLNTLDLSKQAYDYAIRGFIT
ncbi:MAG TPA: hypothetical protein VNS50_00820, partial [Ginsengibacter sp.]|nr:hypothetical protein [Ginsengibacter sp.]